MLSGPTIGSKPHRRVTISDVSNALGLTKSTVSRALNGYPDIADDTRLRVTRMADKMGYRPLSHAQAIRTGRTRSLGLVLQMSEHDAHRPFLAEFLAGLSRGASAEGYTLTVASSASEADTLATFEAMLNDRKADGFVLQRTLRHDPRVNRLRALGVPFLMFGRVEDNSGCAWFDVDGAKAMQDAVSHLVDLGHRRIGYIGGGLPYNYSILRRDGFLAGAKAQGLDITPDLLEEGAVTRGDGAEATRRIMGSKSPPTAIVCAVDMTALGAYTALADLGLKVGQDVSVISYDGIPEGAAARPPLSTFAVDFTAAGRRLSTLLIRRIRGDAPEDLRELVEAEFLNRGSADVPRLSSAELAERLSI